jgi:hypothetical protein
LGPPLKDILFFSKKPHTNYSLRAYTKYSQFFVDHKMQIKQYKIQPDRLSMLNVQTIEFFLDFDEMEFIWSYSEQLFTSTCEFNPYLASLFAPKLAEMAAALECRTDQDFARPGSFVVYDDKSWLTKLAAIAAKKAARLVVPASVAIAAAKELTREIAVYPHDFTPPAAAEVLGTGEESTAQRNAEKPAALYLPALNLGQFMMPTVFARSGLFGADGPRGSRKVFTGAAPRIIRHFSGVRAGQTTFSYTGDELWTSDEEVWTTLLAEAVTAPLGQDVSMRVLDLLRSMPGRGVDGTNPRQRVIRAGVRLNNASLTITTSDPVAIAMIKQCLPKNPAVRDADKKNFLVFTVSLLEQFTASTDIITFRVGRELRALFGDKLHTWYDREAYYSLPSTGLSRRLFMLYNSHFNCHPLTQAELVEFLGIKSKTTSHVRKSLEEAHVELTNRGFDLGHEFRRPAAAERKNCNTPCFVVTRPERVAKVVVVEAEADSAPVDFADDYAEHYAN